MKKTFLNSRVPKVIAAAFLLASIVSVNSATQANHDSGSNAYDTGWMNLASFPGTVTGVTGPDCAGVVLGHVWGQNGDAFEISNFGLPNGTYSIDIVARYGYYFGDPQAPQTNETMRVRTSVDSKNVPDLNGSGGGYEGRDNCPNYRAGIATYTNITSGPITYNGGSIRFEGQNSNSQSIKIYSIRIHGQRSVSLVNDARCALVPQVVTEVERNQVFTASVTLTNTGTKQWTNSDSTPHRLGSQNPQDNMTWGLNRVNLPFSPVNPGQTVTFNFTARAPDQTGLFQFAWRMVEESVEWFGETCSRAINVTNPPAAGNINLTKVVRNVSDNQPIFDGVTLADPNDQVEFQIRVEVSGTVNNIIVSDQLPQKLNYVNNSLTIDGVPAGNNLSSINLGNVSNQTKNIAFRANVAAASQFTGNTSLINTASLTSSVASRSGSATVTVVVGPPSQVICSPPVQNNVPLNTNVTFTASGGTGTFSWSAPTGNPTSATGSSFTTQFAAQGLHNVTVTSGSQSATCQVSTVGVQPPPPPPPPGSPGVTIIKDVRNVSQGQTLYINSIAANPGDQVEFRIVVSAFGNAATGVVVTDTLPQNFTLNSGSTAFNLGNMPAGTSQTVFVLARAATESVFPFGSSAWTNTAVATGSNISTISDTAVVIINRIAPPNPQPPPPPPPGPSPVPPPPSPNPVVGLSIAKDVRNITAGQTIFTNSIAANPGDQVEFRIVVNNFGNTTAQSVNITDTLPNNFLSVSGTNPYFVGSLNAQSTFTLNLVARINPDASFPVGSSSWTNTATATASNAQSVSDMAIVIVNKDSPAVVAGASVDLGQPAVAGAFTAPKTGGTIGLSFLMAFVTVGFSAIKRIRNKRSIRRAINNQP